MFVVFHGTQALLHKGESHLLVAFQLVVGFLRCAVCGGKQRNTCQHVSVVAEGEHVPGGIGVERMHAGLV